MSSAEERPTLQQVADLAGVARPTASLAMNGKGTLSTATRRRVLDAAESLGYVPNQAARSLRTSRSGIVGMYFPRTMHSHERYFLDIVLGALERASEAGYVVALIPPNGEQQRPLTETFEGFLLVNPVPGDPVAELLSHATRPVVTVGPPDGNYIPWARVVGDHAEGSRMLLAHLWEKGARDLAIVLPDPSTIWGRQADETVRAWCAEHGVTPRIAYREFAMDHRELRLVIHELLGDGSAPDALFLSGDRTALVAVEALQEMGLAPGRDVLVASYIDDPAYLTTSPSITSLDTRPKDMGRTQMDLLLQALGGSDTAQHSVVSIAPRLIERESTALHLAQTDPGFASG